MEPAVVAGGVGVVICNGIKLISIVVLIESASLWFLFWQNQLTQSTNALESAEELLEFANNALHIKDDDEFAKVEKCPSTMSKKTHTHTQVHTC